MALPKLTFPILANEYGWQDSQSDVIASQLDGGLPLFRQNVLGNSIRAVGTVVLCGSEIDDFFTFYQTTVCFGALPFEIDLPIDDYLLETHKVKFAPNSLSVRRLTDVMCTVSFELEVEPLEYDEEQGAVIVGLFDEYGEGFDIEFPVNESRLNEIVNTDLPDMEL